MNSKEDILNAVRNSLKNRDKIDYPTVPAFQQEGADLLSTFKKNLELAAGSWYEVTNIEEAQQIMQKKLPDARVICSAAEEWVGNKDLKKIQSPHDLEDVDLGIVRAEFGVAEMGMVWLTEHSLQVNSLGFLSQHIVILLDPTKITENMHTAYTQVGFDQNKYGCFVMGPSATADIGATLVHGAQGPRSLTLFFLAS